MASVLLALALLAGAEPTAPVAPEPPRVEAPAAPAASSRPAAEPSRSRDRSTAPADQPSPSRAPAPGRDDTRPGVRRDQPGRGSSAASAPAGEGVAPKATTVIPPSLTANALRDELRASAQRRQEELAALRRERVRLEKLAADITTARAALEAETAQLDEKVKKAAAARSAALATEAGKNAASAKGAAPQPRPDSKPLGEALAKTLKGMKADQAAALVSRLERRLAVDLLRHMRPADAGTVLEKMKPETAADLFSLMASGEAAGGSR